MCQQLEHQHAEDMLLNVSVRSPNAHVMAVELDHVYIGSGSRVLSHGLLSSPYLVVTYWFSNTQGHVMGCSISLHKEAGEHHHRAY